jgi:multiple sugar transport system permease protein
VTDTVGIPGTTTGQTAPVLPPGGAPGAPAGWRSWLRRPRNPFAAVVYWLLLAFFTLIFLYPFVWAVSASLKTRNDFFDHNAALIPPHFQWVNYKYIFTGVPGLTGLITSGTPYAHWFFNSFYIGILAAATVTASSAVVAFAFAYFQFPLKNFLFALVLGTMMLPGAVTMVPVYLIYHKVHLTGTQYPLWISNLFGSAFYIFLMRQFFLGIPRELFEAARMDGDSYFSMFRRIALPLARPALIVTFIFEFKASWTDLTKPLIYLNHDSQFTLPRGIFYLIGALGPSGGGQGDYEVVMAGTVLATLPMIIIFFLGQRYFMEGIATQGRKG